MPFRVLLGNRLYHYLDDVIVPSGSFDAQLVQLRQVFERFCSAGLTLKPSKCHFCKPKVHFLGHIVSGEGLAADPAKVAAVRDFPAPSNVTELKGFLGLSSYYRRFIHDYSTIAAPLNRLQERAKRWSWIEDCATAFLKLKSCLTNAPILTFPCLSESFILFTDASATGLGAVLSQRIEGCEKVIAYASRSLTKAERNYSTTDCEALALVWAVEYFRVYLLGRKFTLVTDHCPLVYLKTVRNPKGRIARWLLHLSEYDWSIQHREGSSHGNGDGLTRIQCKNDVEQSELAKERTEHLIDIGYSVKPVFSQNVSAAVSLLDDDPPPTLPPVALTPESNWFQSTLDNELSAAQKEDLDIGQVLQWLQDPPDARTVAAASRASQSLYQQKDRLVTIEDVLYRNFDDRNAIRQQLVVPMQMRREVLSTAHSDQSSGHMGVNKTAFRVRQHFYWPDLTTDVKVFCSACPVCRACSNPNPTARAPMQSMQVGYPFQRIAIDILGGLPVTGRGSKYVLVISDYFTRWPEAIPMPNMTADTFARTLFDNVIYRFGCPDVIHSDQGSQFMSALFKQLYKLLDIDQSRTTSYHPQGDGLVERLNRTVLSILRRYVSVSGDVWDSYLQPAMMAIRSSIHSSSGFSPYMALFGRAMQLPLHLVYGFPPEQTPERLPDYVSALRQRFNQCTVSSGTTFGKLLMCKRSCIIRKPEQSSFYLVRKCTCLLPCSTWLCSQAA